MNLTYFGHSAFRIRVDGATLLVDPFITGNPLAEPVVTAADLSADVILLTHAHGDHWGDTVSIAKRTGALVVANFEITEVLRKKHGHANVHAMNTGGSVDFPWGRVTQTHARHSSSFPDGTYGGNPCGYLLHAQGRCIYAAGDTAAFAEMAWIGEENDVSVALLPVGDNFTMGPEESIRAIRMVNPAVVVPTHFNTFPAIRIDIDAWAKRVHDTGFVPRVLAPGETMTVATD
jgi:L-ascorbate metabolism protein UlaG (beta-lactamase superfamily)